jgi:hypothetical protein
MFLIFIQLSLPAIKYININMHTINNIALSSNKSVSGAVIAWLFQLRESVAIKNFCLIVHGYSYQQYVMNEVNDNNFYCYISAICGVLPILTLHRIVDFLSCQGFFLYCI